MAGETVEARRARAAKILDRLGRAYPGADIELHYRTPLELLVATILSAQCTDERVNMVTPRLFARYRRAEDWATADLATLEGEIHSTGFFRAKARALVGMARALVERHGGEVPRVLDDLTALPGVGVKTASVVLGNAFGIPALAVDTHVSRVAQRLGLARAPEALAIHEELCRVVARARWVKATHLLIVHGRRTCHARRPDCSRCAVRDLCPWPHKTPGDGASSTAAGTAAARPTGKARGPVQARRRPLSGRASRGNKRLTRRRSPP